MHCADAMTRIGIISDTHGLLRPEAINQLAGTDHIIHAGDIGAPEMIEGLRKIAPITAIRGNIDAGEWAKDYPDTELVALGGQVLYVLHDLKGIKLDPAVSGIDVVVSGHSHRPKIVTKNGVLYVNPGSAGPRRFKLPIALAFLTLTDRIILPRILEIAT
jgi:putative phosphoesterase